jgi:hypothetical protein
MLYSEYLVCLYRVNISILFGEDFSAQGEFSRTEIVSQFVYYTMVNFIPNCVSETSAQSGIKS